MNANFVLPLVLEIEHEIRLFHHILGGPKIKDHAMSRAEIFNMFFDSAMNEEILQYTNRKGRQLAIEWNENNLESEQQHWMAVDEIELKAFYGILLLIGVNRQGMGNLKDCWHEDALPLYRAAMSRSRFRDIFRAIRFDNQYTRAKRLATDKTAAISDIWSILNKNLQNNYVPHDCLTVDEQLFGYFGRTRFSQYIPSKPAKKGIKVFFITDAKTFYPLQGIIYTGKPVGGERQKNIGENIVTKLAGPYRNTGRNITMDNFFTTIGLARTLRNEYGLSLLGTLKKNKPYIPDQVRPQRKDSKGTIKFAFRSDVTLVSQVTKKGKAVYLLSTMHSDASVIADKPEIINEYNRTKGGVDCMDKMLSTYSTKRKTRRWPLAFFFNMMDIAALAAYVVYMANHEEYIRCSNRRALFLKNLAKELCIPNIQRRIELPLVTKWSSIRTAMENILGVQIHNPVNPNAVVPTRKEMSGHREVIGTCHVCRHNKFKRVTRNSCHKCKKPICDEHTLHLFYGTCCQ